MKLVQKIYMVGMMGAGKSAIGRLLAEYLSYNFIDTDKLIETQGMSIADIFTKRGEEAFRKMESDALSSCQTMSHTVIATGGGLPCHHDNMHEMLKNGSVIYLRASVSTLVKRLRADTANRPLISGDSDTLEYEIQSLLQKRQSCYERAHHIVDTDHDEALAVAEIVAELLT